MEIPGTRYQVHDGNIIGPDGGTITQQEFLQKVESKEISLTSDSLRFLGSQFGPDLEKSLTRASGLTVPTSVLSSRMARTENTMGDIFSLMELLAKVTLDQKKQAYDMKARESDMQITAMNKSADEALAAARVRMIAGVISGAANIASGAMGGIGAMKVMNGPPKLPDGTQLAGDALKTWNEATSGLWGAASKMTEGLAQINQVSMELGAGGHDWNSKMSDSNARMLENMAGETRDMAETLREMNAKVREVIRDMQAAGDQAMGTIIRQ